jgi:predicted MPP superfamily phosphohydrolase
MGEYMTNSLLFTNEHFKIVQLTDLHLLLPKNLFSDHHTYHFIDQLLTVEKPDLVVITGDIAMSFFNYSAMMHFFHFLDSYGIPWAFTFGNHDGQFGRSKNYIAHHLEDFQHSMFQTGPNEIEGYSNYFVNLVDHRNQIRYALYFFDSLIERKHISDSQVNWFIENSNRYHSAVDKLAFFHIPLQEFRIAREEGIISGAHREKISTPENSSFCFNAFKHHRVKAIFVGHDHRNDFTARYQGILLAYGRSSGFTGYGGHKALKGARIIDLWENGKIKTWIVEANWLSYHFSEFKFPKIYKIVVER